MLMKLMINGADFEKSLRRRRLVAAALLGVGLVGFACYFLLVPKSGLSDYATGFYLGGASGITAGALILLCRTQYLLTHPEAKKRAKIQETDEREREIVNGSFRIAGMVTFFVSVAALFVVLPLSVDAFKALFCVIVLYSLSFVAANRYWSKKL